MTNTLLPAVENSDDKMITPLKVHSAKYIPQLAEETTSQSYIDFADSLYRLIDSEMSAFVDKYKRS